MKSFSRLSHLSPTKPRLFLPSPTYFSTSANFSGHKFESAANAADCESDYATLQQRFFKLQEDYVALKTDLSKSNTFTVPNDVRMDWTRQEIAEIFNLPLMNLIFQAAAVHRLNFDPLEVQQATLLSIKTGGCSENCGYCSQSQHHKTFVKPTKTMNLDDVLLAARKAKEAGSTRFCMGAAWREVSMKNKNKDKNSFKEVLEMVKEVNKMGLEVCTTLGMLTEAQAAELKSAGLTAYNHNLDTSPEFYPQVVQTRSFNDRIDTIKNVQKAGISVCSGGIIGLGEQTSDRIGLLHSLATLEKHPDSVPINVLVPVKGTPIGDKQLKLCEEGKHSIPEWNELVRMIATARILMPKSMVRLSAGRVKFSEAEQALMFMAGANSIFMGDTLLTTGNNEVEKDKQMFKMLGLKGREPFKIDTVDMSRFKFVRVTSASETENVEEVCHTTKAVQ